MLDRSPDVAKIRSHPWERTMPPPLHLNKPDFRWHPNPRRSRPGRPPGLERRGRAMGVAGSARYPARMPVRAPRGPTIVAACAFKLRQFAEEAGVDPRALGRVEL